MENLPNNKLGHTISKLERKHFFYAICAVVFLVIAFFLFLFKKEEQQSPPPIKVTIPEGFDISDISKTFSLKLPKFNEMRFLLEASPKEGYLFPDTYFFSATDNEQNVIQSMSADFTKKIAPILPSIISSGKTEKEIMIMASIIEKESKGDNDRALISGILWKRLAMDIPLEVDSDPSTYKIRGLPLSPICNPGLKSIEAAINPQASDYLYYLHDKEGNIHFASTFEEHKLNKIKYLN
jgi:UPF0755 protein